MVSVVKVCSDEEDVISEGELEDEEVDELNGHMIARGWR